MKSVPVAFQRSVWVGSRGLMTVSDLGAERSSKAIEWVDGHIDTFLAGHLEAMSEEDQAAALEDPIAWWRGTPLFAALEEQTRVDGLSAASDSAAEPEPEPVPEPEPEPAVVMPDPVPEPEPEPEPAVAVPESRAAVATDDGDSVGAGLDRVHPRWPIVLAAVSAVVVAVASMAMSFNATAELATRVGAVSAGYGWLVPIAIDGGLLACSASLAAWSSAGKKTRRPMLATVAGTAFLLVSAFLNAAHAEPAPLARFIAAIAPISLLVSVELALSLRRHAGTGRYPSRP